MSATKTVKETKEKVVHIPRQVFTKETLIPHYRSVLAEVAGVDPEKVKFYLTPKSTSSPTYRAGYIGEAPTQPVSKVIVDIGSYVIYVGETKGYTGSQREAARFTIDNFFNCCGIGMMTNPSISSDNSKELNKAINEFILDLSRIYRWSRLLVTLRRDNQKATVDNFLENGWECIHEFNNCNHYGYDRKGDPIGMYVLDLNNKS